MNGPVSSAAFSLDSKTLVLCGYFTGGAKVYSINNNTITYVSNIYADNGTTSFNDYVYSIVFSPDSKTLVLGGYFTGHAKIYSIQGTTVTYVSDIYADNSNTALNGSIKSASFSPDGKTLVLVGNFTGKAKVYSVNGTTITYVNDIYADNNDNALNSTISSVDLSPDGKTLVLGGCFTGRAKIYSVNGTTITYVSNIYANAGTTALNNTVYSAAFSPDGGTLILGGGFTGYAKVYFVNGNIISYVSDVNIGTTTLSSTVYSVSFSSNSTTFVLSGYFKDCAKIYFISAQTHLAPNGILSEIPSGARIGYALTSANQGEYVKVKTIGELN